MPYEPLHHKYRPQTFKDLVGQETIALTLSNALKQEKIAPAYLFTGPRGTGKTSSARILAKSLNCLATNQPTPKPCGKCEACMAIANGTALDVMEIDAASNTGVDNIREIIERSRFAPVQCRYKIYVIDECLTGDSLIQTSEGLIRIDNPNLKGKTVISYNENTKTWEYKKVLRWLERGTKKTLTINTSSHQIRCTENHLIRTEKGWIEAKNVKEGMKILSPVNADVRLSSINMERTEECADLQQDISLKETNTEQNLTILAKSSNKQKRYSLCVNADVMTNSIFPTFSEKKEKAFKVSNPTGKNIHTKRVTESGIFGVKTSLILPSNCKRSNWDSSMEHCWGMEASTIPTHTVDFLDYVGLMENNSKNGWSIRQAIYNNYVQKCKALLIEDMAKNQSFAERLATLSYEKFMKLLNQTVRANQFPWNGFNLLHQKDWHGGTWMTVLFNLVHKAVLQSFFTLRDFLNEKIKLLPTGLQIWDILPTQNPISENLHKKFITTSKWEQNQVENGCQICDSTQFPRWTTNLEKVESVYHAGHEKVYDLEVEDNHNFVANGLLVHNCHMLSTAAFNALLKTLEEPPPKVVFILATTDPQRVLSTIISRCQRFDYRRIPLAEMIAHLQYIAKAEKIAIADEALTLIAQIANGGLRDAESLLDQLSLLPEKISVNKVWDLIGAVPEQDLLELLKKIRNNLPIQILQKCRNLLDRGREPLIVLQNLASFYLNLLIAKNAPQRTDMVAVTEICWQELCQEAAHWDIALILKGQQHLKDAETQLKHTTQPRLWLEVTLLGLLSGNNSPVVNTQSQIVANLLVADGSKPAKSNHVNHKEAKTQSLNGASGRNHIPLANTTPSPASPSQTASIPEKVVNQQELRREDHIAHQKNQTPTKITRHDSLNCSQSSEPVLEPELDKTPPNSAPIVNVNIPNEELWNKVVSCLHPPTTKALLKQQCHLVSFDGSSAIVGISSNKLQKLHQGKVSNIEAAFAQVCQHKIKVHLEVTTSVDVSAKNSLTSIDKHNPIPQKPDPDQNDNYIPSSVNNSQLSQPQTDHTEVIGQQVRTQGQVSQTSKSNSPLITSSTSVSNPERNFLSSEKREFGRGSSLLPNEPNLGRLTTNSEPERGDFDASGIENKTVGTPEVIIEQNLNEDYTDNNLQQAIDNLTRSFEGELVQLENNQSHFGELSPESEQPEQSNLNPSSQGRPNVEDYDDVW